MRISCTGAKCAVTEVEYMASGAINYFTASFTFDSAWSDFISANKLYGVFEGSDTVILATLIYNSQAQTYDCEVPWEVLKYQGELLVGAIGYIETPEVKILTTNMAFGYKIPEGAATNATTGSQPSGLLLEILEVTEEIEANANRAESARDTAVLAKTAAKTAETNAETAESNAKTYATNAGNSATAAANSATSAQNYANSILYDIDGGGAQDTTQIILDGGSANG